MNLKLLLIFIFTRLFYLRILPSNLLPETTTLPEIFTEQIEQKQKINSVFFMFRHGARTPTHFLSPGYKAQGYDKEGMLTLIGGQQLEALGKTTSQKYSFFDSKSVVFISSFRERNIDSMTNFTKAFPFPTKRVFYTRKESDFLFHSQYFDPKFQEKRHEMAEKEGMFIDGLFKLVTQDLGGLELLNKFNPEYKADNAYNKLDALSHLYTSLRCNEVNNIENQFTLTPDLRKELEYSFSFQMYKINYQKNNFRKRRTNELIILLGKQVLSIIKPFERYSDIYFKHYAKFSNTYYEVDPAMFLSCHDTNLMGMLSVFMETDELLSTGFYVPEFAGFISFELIDINPKDYFVEFGHGIEGDKREPQYEVLILYDGVEIMPKQCAKIRCSLEIFIEILDQNSSDCHSHDCIREIDININAKLERLELK